VLSGINVLQPLGISARDGGTDT